MTEPRKPDRKLSLTDTLRAGNFPLALMLIQVLGPQHPDTQRLYYLAGLMALSLKQYERAQTWFDQAGSEPEVSAAQRQLDTLMQNAPDPARHRRTSYLLIKAWGYGFWSDVYHVLGQLYLAELTGRVPVIAWGRNSLFGDGTDNNHFEAFFELEKSGSLEDIQENLQPLDLFPAKWRSVPITTESLNIFDGPDSRTSGLWTLGRYEQVVVSDFYTGLLELLPWQPDGNLFVGPEAIDVAYHNLAQRYLVPRAELQRKADQFRRHHIGDEPYLAVHVRGTDKYREIALDPVNRQILEASKHLAADLNKVFLMTDDLGALSVFKEAFGDRLVFTDSLRSNSQRGLHYEQRDVARKPGQQLGFEVMIDTLIAREADAFAGNAHSNVATMVAHWGHWKPGRVQLFGPNLHHQPNLVLHQWPDKLSRAHVGLDPIHSALEGLPWA